jgi:hypothetical protein
MIEADAIAATREAVRLALLADAPLVELLGGPRIFIEPPAPREFPCITFGEATADDSRAEAFGSIEFALRVWSRNDGERAHMLCGALLQALDEAWPITLANGRELAVLFAECPRTWHGLVHVRAVVAAPC